MAERTPDRLTRLLALVAHLSQAGPTPLVDLARFLEYRRSRSVKTLMSCG